MEHSHKLMMILQIALLVVVLVLSVLIYKKLYKPKEGFRVRDIGPAGKGDRKVSDAMMQQCQDVSRNLANSPSPVGVNSTFCFNNDGVQVIANDDMNAVCNGGLSYPIINNGNVVGLDCSDMSMADGSYLCDEQNPACGPVGDSSVNVKPAPPNPWGCQSSCSVGQ